MFVLVTGANGQLGRSIKSLVDQNKTNYQFLFAAREQLDLENFKNVRSFIENNQFDVILNCAAYTAVDRAETEIKKANSVNHLAVKNIAEIAKDNYIKLIHISTDYVFDGFKPESYNETDKTLPLNVYGKSKLEGENAIFSVMKSNAIIIRTSWVYSVFGNNFVDTILNLIQKKNNLHIISDQVGSPTNAKDLAGAIISIINNKKFNETDIPSQVFHYSNDGGCSWYDFAKEIANISGTKCVISPIDSKDYPQEALRPKYVLMNKTKIQNSFDLKIHFWSDSLKTCIQELSTSSK